MRAARLICLAVLLALLLPGLARAAPEPITVSAYRSRLESALIHMQAGRTGEARAAMGEAWLVQTSPEPVLVDMRPLLAEVGGANAMTLVREHLAALDALERAAPRSLPNARRHLDEALGAAEEESKAANTLASWWDRFWDRIFGGSNQPTQVPDRASASGPSAATWVALAVGAVGIGLLGWFLLRSLQGHAGGEQVALRPGRRAARPDRPLTPDELWQLAGEEAAAGDYKEGLRLAHLALLQHLDRSGLLRYLPAQTNREHEWSLRRKHPELARTMHHLNDLVESRLYSGHGASADDFKRGESIALQLWREGEAASKSGQATNGASSSASSS
ncbi:MAG: hypothetical protein K0R39_3900 [Symbiobacteriaceae bacterium]|jgi:hypothetical protein|nr:hypothetical protein [Symbiobacteriaceae bacterium]